MLQDEDEALIGWIRASVIRRSAAVAFVSALVGGLLVQSGLIVAGRGWPWGEFWAITVSAASASAIITGLVARRGIVSRITRLRKFLEDQVGQGHFLQRLPDLGPDELGQAADALNRLLASITTLRVSLIDQGRVLAETQE